MTTLVIALLLLATRCYAEALEVVYKDTLNQISVVMSLEVHPWFTTPTLVENMGEFGPFSILSSRLGSERRIPATP